MKRNIEKRIKKEKFSKVTREVCSEVAFKKKREKEKEKERKNAKCGDFNERIFNKLFSVHFLNKY